MRRTILFLSILLLNSFLGFSQLHDTAKNFTATDCNSISHNLYNELSTNKVIVLVWVMPCGSCINDAAAASDAALSFATSNPGKVLFWLSDDLGDNTCSDIRSWASTNGIDTTIIFSNSGNTINEDSFGGAGMPHVVVIGANRKLYYNHSGGSNYSADYAIIKDSITLALSSLGVIQLPVENRDITLAPNPVKNKATISFYQEHAGETVINVFNLIGAKIKSINLPYQGTGQHVTDIEFDRKLPNGIYFLQLKTGNKIQTKKFEIIN